MQKDAHLVELEKCCQTHIFLQKFVLIQPRTSPPKFLLIFPILLTPIGGPAPAAPEGAVRLRGPAADGALRAAHRGGLAGPDRQGAEQGQGRKRAR